MGSIRAVAVFCLLVALAGGAKLIAAAETETPGQSAAPAAAEGRSILDFSEMDFSDRVDLFRSSAFFNPRNPEGTHQYRSIGNHFAARLFGAFNWQLDQSASLAAFRSRVRDGEEYLAWLSRTHRKLMISINYMPAWLSVSEDSRVIEGFYKERNTRSPDNYERWNRLVRTVVEYYRRFTDVEMYYEVWNEPDGLYWTEDTEAYLRLYEQTARTVKAADPRAKVGGAAVNGWDGWIDDPDGRPLNVQLVHFAKRRQVPLDFLSWHHFTSLTEPIGQAVEAYRAAFAEAGYVKAPELVISEWNVDPAFRNTRLQVPLMADLLLGFHDAGVDIQMVAAWQDFHPAPDPDGYGLVTHAGRPKPAFYLHGAFDRLARDSDGIAIIRQDAVAAWEGARRIVVSKKRDGRYAMLVYEAGQDPPTAAAFRRLEDAGMTRRDFAEYGSLERLLDSVITGRPRHPAHREAFIAARAVYESFPVRLRPVEIEIANARTVEVDSAIVIGSGERPAEVTVQGKTITYNLEKLEVLLLELRLP